MSMRATPPASLTWHPSIPAHRGSPQGLLLPPPPQEVGLTFCRTRSVAPEAHSPLPLQVLGVKSCYPLALSPSPAIMGDSSYPSSFQILQTGSRCWSLLFWAPSLLGPGQSLPGIAGHCGGQRTRLISSNHTSAEGCQPATPSGRFSLHG